MSHIEAGMRIGIFAGDVSGRPRPTQILEDARRAAEDGFASFWLPHIVSLDALTMAGAVGHVVPDIEIGTAVVPTYPRHPMALAQQALTSNALAGGRLILGIGPSHRVLVEDVLGLSYARPLRHLREYLCVLRALVSEQAVTFAGETLTVDATIHLPDVPACPILVAALGPKMLNLAGELADGTVTWMTGPATLAEHTVPLLRASAARHGRPQPRVVAGVPICVTDDEAAARGIAARRFGSYAAFPAYRAMLDREGVDGPADMAIVGSEEAVRTGIARYADAGVTDLLTVEYSADPDEQMRTRTLLASLT